MEEIDKIFPSVVFPLFEKMYARAETTPLIKNNYVYKEGVGEQAIIERRY